MNKQYIAKQSTSRIHSATQGAAGFSLRDAAKSKHVITIIEASELIKVQSVQEDT